MRDRTDQEGGTVPPASIVFNRDESLFVHVYRHDRDVGVREQQFEPALLFALERLLVWEQFLDVGGLIIVVVRHRRISPDDRHPIIPTCVFTAVIERGFRLQLDDAPFRDLLLQERMMIFLYRRMNSSADPHLTL